MRRSSDIAFDALPLERLLEDFLDFETALDAETLALRARLATEILHRPYPELVALPVKPLALAELALKCPDADLCATIALFAFAHGDLSLAQRAAWNTPVGASPREDAVRLIDHRLRGGDLPASLPDPFGGTLDVLNEELRLLQLRPGVLPVPRRVDAREAQRRRCRASQSDHSLELRRALQFRHPRRQLPVCG